VSSGALSVCLLPGCALQAAIALQEATTAIDVPRLIMVLVSLSSLEIR
jgi:hypothetical protein